MANGTIDITLIIKANAPARGNLTTAQKAPLYINGDIVIFYPTAPNATFSDGNWHWNNQLSIKGVDAGFHFWYVHLVNMPTANDKAFRLYEDIAAAGEMLRMRHYIVLPGTFSAPKQAELDSESETTITWGEAQSDTVRKRVVIDSDDATLDDFSTHMSDGDLR